MKTPKYSIRRMSVTALTVMALSSLPGGVFAEIDAMDLGREYTRLFFAGELTGIWNMMSPQMHGALGNEGALSDFRDQAQRQLGQEQAVVSERVDERGGMQIYLRTARFEKLDQLINVQWAFDGVGTIVGFFIRPVQKEAATEFLDYETKTSLRLPFKGEWYVFWGGRTLEQNYHTFTVDQRFAYDILIMKSGASHSGGGTRNEDYYCFGEPVLAPGDGVVVVTENDVVDNTPGELNPEQAMGNHVIIDHENGEFSFLAHFKRGSVVVERGQSVKSGDLLGLCGNSGNTTEAHIHYHLQDTSVFNRGAGLPAWFNEYIADGKPVARGEPVKGQSIAPDR